MTWISLAEATCHVGTSDDMVMDQAGGMLIGGALVMLFSRMALALMRQRAIKEARTQHYSDAALARSYSLPGAAWVRSVTESMPPRMRIGLAMGLAGAVVPFTARKLSGALVGDGDGVGSHIGRSLFIAGKWLVLGAILQQARKWGVGRMLQGRPAAQRDR